MSVYTVFEPPKGTQSPSERAERFVFIRDGFSWGAVLFGPLWIAWHRLWLVLAAFVLVTGALETALRLVDATSTARALIAALIALFIGFEAPSLRRWTLLRNGWSELGTVVGDELEAAERRFFDAWVADQGRRRPTSLPPTPMLRVPQSRSSEVVGLFPEPGASR